MTAVHHIQRQCLILEAEVSAAIAGRWHARLEELHDGTLLPIIDRELTALVGQEVLVIERLEVELEVDDPEQLEAAVAEQFALAFRAAVKQSTAGKVARQEVDSFEDALYFFRTGNLSWRAGSGERFFMELPEQAKHWTQRQWMRLFRFFAEQPDVFFGRCTQVQGEFLRLAWTRLQEITVAANVSSEPTGEVFRKQEEPTLSRWKKALDIAGFGGRQSAADAEDRLAASVNIQMNEVIIAEESTFYYVPNAGLVILHPYLKYMVEELGIRTNRTLKGLGKAAPGADFETLRASEAESLSSFERPASKPVQAPDLPRMAALLHYAVSGGAEFCEWEHPLTKLLLGLEPTDPLMAGLISAEDRAFVDELLRGIIEHWSALGNTSVEALREAFLLRPGRLGREAGGWSLQVESRPYDLLLQKLPWGIGMVKSPWMTDLLQVEWS